jgi:tRNA-intron lyase
MPASSHVARARACHPACDPAGSAAWSYPSTPQEQLSYAIFSDLHSKGFSITVGIKFGAEFLVYPGDPALYHAQFTVRTVAWGAPLDPVLLKSIARGSHAARKHLMLASMRPAADGNGFVPYYISVAPQLGFGHQNQ